MARKRTGKKEGAPFNNQNAVKLKTEEIKKEAYRQYCEHIGLGFAKKAFYFESDDLEITHKTMEAYIAEDPVVFPPLKMEIAQAKSLKKWEQVVMDSADGTNKDASTASLQMLMRNKFDWDSKKLEEQIDENLDQKHKDVLSQLDRLQQP